MSLLTEKTRTRAVEFGVPFDKLESGVKKDNIDAISDLFVRFVFSLAFTVEAYKDVEATELLRTSLELQMLTIAYMINESYPDQADLWRQWILETHIEPHLQLMKRDSNIPKLKLGFLKRYHKVFFAADLQLFEKARIALELPWIKNDNSDENQDAVVE